ncbi:hypothetical protein [Flectobacillus sp. BAB-3569]|uniref:hypothetical protein n=1 Tax=Flectobacillus sp. BAB-3569 TaxID=1509483 RepID=UPI000BA2BD5A|nr:hypothetical protein [Flectobacillus sp. BAB-3569]PAC29227.1 hypothetical protein BWI92_16495 [Flectobacillus sp. BAB-3569]
MNDKLYTLRPLNNQSFFQRLFNQLPEENSVIELNNLLATKPILCISQTDIDGIENRYKLSMLNEFRLNLEEFYAVYLNYCLVDKVLTDTELQELSHLKKILGLDDKTIENLHIKIGEIVYKQSLQEAVSDGRLTKIEIEFLEELENTLRLPKELAYKISYETRSLYVQNFVSKIINNKRLSPAEEKELNAISESLNISIELDGQIQEKLKKLKRYWAIENLDLPVIESDITIQKSEVLYLKIPNVNWFEFRGSRYTKSHTGHSTSYNLIKDFYLNPEGSTSNSHKISNIRKIDIGTLYLTNKRIIFQGIEKNSNIRIERIANFAFYSDYVEIVKDTGKNPTLQIKQNVDIFCMMLERLLKR